MFDQVRYRGALLGLAVGDALGTTIEFMTPGSFTPVREITGGGPFKLKPGEWTDDTSLALCLAESLIESKGFSKKDQLDRYARWMNEGYLSSNGVCFDIGNTTRYSIRRYMSTGIVDTDLKDSRVVGNGSIMRLAPVPMYYGADPVNAIEMSGESSRTTHGAKAAVDACRYMGGLIHGALNGVDKETLLSERYAPVQDYWTTHKLTSKVDAIAVGSYKEKNPPRIKGTGYAVKSLEAALWAFHNSSSFEEGCLLAVNLGDDADTTGAVYGQIAGAYYTSKGIPKRWNDKIVKKELITGYADKLWRLASAHAS
ncbi:ADP-ribosylglycohydrolase family protein [Candidatus Bathyarchaeota archaeon]|nr:MAG: ADP-ribosylglycohydrolase family protein [Candidatus Bathyarchaeota archaeon]